jgi:hypothetical protein
MEEHQGVKFQSLRFSRGMKECRIDPDAWRRWGIVGMTAMLGQTFWMVELRAQVPDNPSTIRGVGGLGNILAIGLEVIQSLLNYGIPAMDRPQQLQAFYGPSTIQRKMLSNRHSWTSVIICIGAIFHWIEWISMRLLQIRDKNGVENVAGDSHDWGTNVLSCTNVQHQKIISVTSG